MRVLYAIGYVLWLASEVIRQAMRLGRDVLTPGLNVSPSIVEFPLRAESRFEVASIESSITITPGTLTLGVFDPGDGSPRSLFVHFLYAHTHEGAVAELEAMERRLLKATRGRDWERS